jgi:tetratricopeptide (TPR) repeat protein/predicted Ser/Thr protein kinase
MAPSIRLRGSLPTPHAHGVGEHAVEERDDAVGTVILTPAAPDDAGLEPVSEARGLQSGDTVGPYQLVERLGAGGMGVVWVARDPRLGRTVAVKLLHEQRRRRGAEQARERLRREALALARLSHPNVVSIYDVGVHGTRVFLTMEHVEGRTLDAWAAEAPSLPRVLEVFEQVAAGLAAVHAAGFVHRDLKPANVMIDRDGRVLVMDFGLARIHDPESVSDHEALSSSRWNVEAVPFSIELTGDGVVMGTPAYMAPEQHLGAEADARADQFAFCATLYEVLLGQRPFRGRSVEELAKQKLAEQLDFEGCMRLPRAVRALLRRGLAPEPSRRFANMEALRDALARLRRPGHRRVLAFTALGVAAVGGVGWAALHEPTQTPCEAGVAQMATVWNDDARTELEQAFEATGLPYAEDAAQRATGRLDAYAHEWAEGFARACHAAGPDDAAALDLRMRCLSDARASMVATVELLGRADATAVQRAVTQVAGLPPITHCDDIESLQAEVAPPTDPAVAAGIDAVRQQLEQAAALDRAGHYAEARELAQAALDRAIELGYEPAIARARIRVAVIDIGLGDAEASRRGLTEAALLAASIDDHPAAADAASRLAYVLAEELGQPDEALRWARHAEASLDRMPPDPLARARLDGSLGVVYATQGDYAAGLLAFERSYAAKREILGEEHPEVAGALENMALSHSELGRPAEAERIQQRSLALIEKAVGPRHPDTALSLLNLGHSLDGLGRHDEAAAAFGRALEIFREALGPRHPMVARTLSSLGHSAGSQDRLREAEAYFREAGEIIEEVHGERHREHAWSLADRAHVTADLGREEEAVVLFTRAREILEASLGPDHDSLAYMMMDEASALVELERTDEAEPLVERAGEILGTKLEPGHPGLADWHAARAELLRGQKRLEAAREAGATALAVATAALGLEHPMVASLLLSLGEVELELQRYADAQAHLRRAVALTEAAPVGEGFRAAARFALAKALWPDPAMRDESLALARRAQEGFATHGDVFQEDVDETTEWLRDHFP